MRHWLVGSFVLLMAAIGLQDGLAQARNSPAAPLDLRYAMYLGGFHVADLELVHEENGAGGYRAELKTRTVGAAELLLRYRARASVEGVRLDSAGLTPETYRYRYKSRKSRRHVEVSFNPERREAIAVESTKRGKPDPSDVPPELWSGVIDPLTAFLHLRHELLKMRTQAPAPLAVEVFDGRRRYQLTADPKGRVQLGDRGVSALRIDLALTPIAGFDDDKFKATEPGESLRADILLSDDERLVPLRIATLNASARIVIQLEQDCSRRSACRAPARKDAALAPPQTAAAGLASTFLSASSSASSPL